MKAAIYSRFSTDRQTESSIADQVRVCAEYATREGWRIVEKHEDQGISGAALGNRPGVLRMHEAALARRFDVLLVTDLTRLSRSNGDLSKLIDQLVAKGVRVIGVQDGYDSSRRGHKLQAGLSGIIGEAFRDMIRDRTHAALESRAKERRPTGGKCYGYRDNAVEAVEAAIVREIFERYVAGASCRTIAGELNVRGIPSPGSAWNRRQRRCSGWMGSAIRAILANERYTGVIRWNTSEWRKDPDTGKRLRYERPRSDWLEHRDESLRIVSDNLFARAAARTRDVANPDVKLKAGGKSRYLLSGLLRCGACGAHYIMTNKYGYQCSGYVGGACSNGARVRRDRIQALILDPIQTELLAPERVKRMAEEMQRDYAARAREAAQRADEAPAELQAIEARLTRLRERLAAGDPDLEADELEAAIERAEQKRRELMAAQPAAKESARLVAMLPKAADEYRKQIAMGLDDNPRAALKARAVLRKLMPGNVRLVPKGEELWAEYALQPAALLASGQMVAGVGFEPTTFGL